MSETVNNDCESEDVKDNLDSVLECVDVESAGSASTSSTGAVKRPVSSSTGSGKAKDYFTVVGEQGQGLFKCYSCPLSSIHFINLHYSTMHLLFCQHYAVVFTVFVR